MKLKVLAGMLVATTALAFSPIDDLNEAVVGLLKPINNNLTKAEIVFESLEVDDKRALLASVVADYRKKGELTDLHLSIPDMSYAYNGTWGPTASFNVGITTDLLAIVDQETINEMGPMVSEIVTDLAMDYLEQYGPAAEVEVKTVEEKYDDAGNLINIIVSGRVKVDLKKLPETVPVEDVMFKSVNVRLKAGLDGFSAQGTVIMNKDYRAFQEDQEGLKELIEELLAQDPNTMRGLQETAMWVDSMVSDAINEGFKVKR